MRASAILWLALALAPLLSAAPPTSPAQPIQIESVLVTLIEQVEVPARVVGVLTKLEVREGDLVEEGNLLGRIEDEQALLAQARAEVELEIARQQASNDIKLRAADKAVDVARAELKRALDSIQKYKQSVSATELDRLKLVADQAVLQREQSQLDLQTAGLTVKSKEHELEFAAREVERRRIMAPLTGVVVQVHKRKGEWLEPGATVMRILRVDRLRVEAFLDSKLVTRDMVGRPVQLTVDLPGKRLAKFPGSVVFVSPEINPVNGQVRVWAEVENAELLLRPGQQASLTISPAVPQAALNAKPVQP